MSDANKYVNCYIETTVGVLHQYLNDVLQLKTQQKLSDDLISEKDKVIVSLQEQISSHKNNEEEITIHKNNAVSWENQFNAMKIKVSHMDTMSNQVVEMKKAIQEKDAKLFELNNELNNKNNEVNQLQTKITELENMSKAAIINKRRKSATKDVSSSIVITEANSLFMPEKDASIKSDDF